MKIMNVILAAILAVVLSQIGRDEIKTIYR